MVHTEITDDFHHHPAVHLVIADYLIHQVNFRYRHTVLPSQCVAAPCSNHGTKTVHLTVLPSGLYQAVGAHRVGHLLTMTTDLATSHRPHDSLDLAERDREAAQAVADGIRDAKAENTFRTYASAWRRFQAWAEAGGHPALPTALQAVALYLGHLAAIGRSMASIEQARAAVSHFHAAVGMQKADNPARHPLVAEAERGWRNQAPVPRQADALTADALAQVRDVLLLPRSGRG